MVTHAAVALLPAALSRRILAGPLVVGALLPDLAARVPAMGLELLAARTGLPLPAAATHVWAVLHTPLGTGALCVLLALLAPEERRPAVLGWLLAGAGAHYLLDLVQDHHGQGYHLLFPLSRGDWELGWFSSEYSLDLAPWLALAAALAWGVRWLADRRKSTE